MLSSAGSPPSKVYGNIRAVASRAAERFWGAVQLLYQGLGLGSVLTICTSCAFMGAAEVLSLGSPEEKWDCLCSLTFFRHTIWYEQSWCWIAIKRCSKTVVYLKWYTEVWVPDFTLSSNQTTADSLYPRIKKLFTVHQKAFEFWARTNQHSWAFTTTRHGSASSLGKVS